MRGFAKAGSLARTLWPRPAVRVAAAAAVACAAVGLGGMKGLLAMALITAAMVAVAVMGAADVAMMLLLTVYLARFALDAGGAALYVAVVVCGIGLTLSVPVRTRRQSGTSAWIVGSVVAWLVSNAVWLARSFAAGHQNATDVLFNIVGLTATFCGFLLVRRTGDWASVRRLLNWIVAAAAAEALIVLIQVASPGVAGAIADVVGRPMLSEARNYAGYVLPVERDVVLAYGTLGNHLLLGNFMVLSAPLTWAMAGELAGARKTALRGIAALQALALVASFSRQNLLGLLVAGAAMLLLSSRKGRIGMGIGVLGLATCVVGTPMLSVVLKGWDSYTAEQGVDLWVRLAAWQEAFGAVRSSVFAAVFGSPVNGTAQDAQVHYATSTASARLSLLDGNSLLATWVQQGLIGVSALLSATVAACLALLRSARGGGESAAVSRGLLAGVAGVYAALMFDNKLAVMWSLPKFLVLTTFGVAAAIASCSSAVEGPSAGADDSARGGEAA